MATRHQGAHAVQYTGRALCVLAAHLKNLLVTREVFRSGYDSCCGGMYLPPFPSGPGGIGSDSSSSCPSKLRGPDGNLT